MRAVFRNSFYSLTSRQQPFVFVLNDVCPFNAGSIGFFIRISSAGHCGSAPITTKIE